MALTFMINIMPTVFSGHDEEIVVIHHSVLHNFQPVAEYAII
jgi:hypothetical protein